ncbi:MIF4G like-domain-containing protein [Schizophyllum fasciatum]
MHDRRRPPPESPATRVRNLLVHLGNVDAAHELPTAERAVRDFLAHGDPNVVADALDVALTEQPFKIPVYAALLRRLHDVATLHDDLWKRFHAHLDQQRWRHTRLHLHLYAHQARAWLVVPNDLADLLKSFSAVLDEVGVTHSRAKRAALCAVEGVLIAGKVLPPDVPAQIIASIEAYVETTAAPQWFVRPTALLHARERDPVEDADELLASALAALRAAQAENFATDAWPAPYSDAEPLPEAFSPRSLPAVLVPPEAVSLDDPQADLAPLDAGASDDWPEYYLRLFADEVTPSPRTPVGYAIRSWILDTIDIFEVNRKEAARALLELPRWCLPGTVGEGGKWSLESTVMETILARLLTLPACPHPVVYYGALVTEICKLTPSKGGPAVGRSIRRLYAWIGEGLDPALSVRFAGMFSLHMSNFGFAWVWKEWIPDLEFARAHPKQVFMRRAVELEIRLSYYERIAKTLPEPIAAAVLPPEAPGPHWAWEDSAHPQHDAAQGILNLLRGRAKAEDVITHLETVKGTLEGGDVADAEATVRDMATQALLNVGSRSFSHLLNAIERYLPLLRTLAGQGGSARADILVSAASFWAASPQLITIVFDKLMQYQMVDPKDVVAWAFVRARQPRQNLSSPAVKREDGVKVEDGDTAGAGAQGLTITEWDVLRAAVDKANGRVIIARRKLAALRREEDERRARAVAGMEVDGDGEKEVKEESEENPAVQTALNAFESLTAEQKGALSKTLEGFADLLTGADSPVAPAARAIVTEKSWHNRANWSEVEWAAWGTWGWYKNFTREFAVYLRPYATALSTVAFAKLQDDTSPTNALVMKIFNVAVGAE